MLLPFFLILICGIPAVYLLAMAGDAVCRYLVANDTWTSQ